MRRPPFGERRGGFGRPPFEGNRRGGFGRPFGTHHENKETDD
jgi:hypothetical protein